MLKGRRGRRPSTAPVDDAGDSKDAKQMPFWEDLYSVTDVVAPWCLFSKLMVTPEVPLKLPVPTSFMFIPDEKLVARISTGLDGKLCVRNDSKETPVTFEMMETNLIESFTSRVTDRQPYICTIYSATDFRPRFVSKANFTLFTLYLRASLGQNISSYGREEQEQASQLFPPKIACVQAYIPIEMDKRFISVFLKSSIRTLVEVHQVPYYPEAKIKFFVHEPPVGEEKKLSLLTRDDPRCSYMTRTTAGIVSCLRNYHDAQIPGFVCEFVQGIDGNVYFTSVLRIAKPVVDMFPSEVVEVSRVISQGGAGRATVQKIAAKMAIRAARGDSPRKDAGARGLTPRVRGGTTPRVAAGVASVVGGGGKMMPRGGGMTATSKLTPRVGTMSSVASMTTPRGAAASSKTGPRPMDDSPGSRDRHGQGEDKEQAPANREGGQDQLVSPAPGGRAGDAVRKGTPSAMSPSAGTHSSAVSPQSKEHTLENEHRAGQVSHAIAKEPPTGRAQRAALLEMAEMLHEQGSFADAIDILAKAEASAAADEAAAKHARANKTAGKVSGVPAGTCFRCGDFVFVEADKAGSAYTHHEWRQKFKADEARQRGEDPKSDRNRGAGKNKIASMLENSLGKMEMQAKKSTEDEYLQDGATKNKKKTLCAYCLDELSKDVGNKRFALGIQRARDRAVKA